MVLGSASADILVFGVSSRRNGWLAWKIDYLSLSFSLSPPHHSNTPPPSLTLSVSQSLCLSVLLSSFTVSDLLSVFVPPSLPLSLSLSLSCTHTPDRFLTAQAPSLHPGPSYFPSPFTGQNCRCTGWSNSEFLAWTSNQSPISNGFHHAVLPCLSSRGSTTLTSEYQPTFSSTNKSVQINNQSPNWVPVPVPVLSDTSGRHVRVCASRTVVWVRNDGCRPPPHFAPQPDRRVLVGRRPRPYSGN